MAHRMTSPVLVGRDEVMAQLSAAFEAARSGAPRHVIIGGEAGVGKTRVLLESRTLADAAGMRVLSGGCVSMGDECLPFAPYAEVVRRLVAEDGAASVGTIAGRASADLARLVPALERGAGSPDQELWAQTRLYEALFDLFRRYADRTPLVIQLEDMHWADSDTLAATAFLLRAIHDEPITVVATFRADEVTRRHPLRPWLAEVTRGSSVDRIDLDPLDGDGIARLIREISGQDPSMADFEAIQLRSDGNPFFIEELLASADSMGETMPSSLRDVLLARIDRQVESARTLLEVAAVGGRVVEHEALVTVSGRSEMEVGDDVGRLVEAGLLVPTQALDEDDAYAFRHALLLEAVYDGMLPTQRRRLHGVWGDVLAAHAASVATGAAHLLQLAHHWREAKAERALATTIDAAAAAIRGFSFDTGAREYEAALQLWDDDDPLVTIDHVELLERTARASMLASRYRPALAACRAAIEELRQAERLDRARLTLLLILLGRTQWVSGDWAGAVPSYEEALATAPADPPIVRIRALAGLGQVYMLHNRLSEARPLCEEAIAGAVDIGDRVMEGHGRNTLGMVLAGLGETAAARTSLAEALKIALEVRDPDDIGRAYVNGAEAESWAGYPDRGFELCVEGMRVAAEWGVAASYGSYLGFGAVSFGFDAGKWHEAFRILSAADRLAGSTEGTYVYRATYVLELMACSGDARFGSLWTETRRLMLERGASDNAGLAYMGGVQHHAINGDHEAAVAIAFEGIELIGGAELWLRSIDLARVAAWPTAEVGRAARHAGDDDGLTRAREQMTRLVELSRDVRAELDPDERLAMVLHLDAEQVAAERDWLEGEDSTDAVARWIAIADGWQEVGRPFRSAMARLRLAEVAEAAGERETAAEGLRESHRIATALGAAPAVARIEALARRLRVRVDAAASGDRPPDVAAYGLTRREHEVLAEVAAGRTNREIAGALFISESTAGVHVSNILGKLGVSTRTEAARLALDEGLVGA